MAYMYSSEISDHPLDDPQDPIATYFHVQNPKSYEMLPCTSLC